MEMVSTVSGRTMEESFVQESKKEAGIVVIGASMTADVMPVSKHTPCPKVVTEAGILISERLEHFANA